MIPQRIRSHPLVHQNRGCLAIRRGPFIYCLESTDQDSTLTDLRLARIDPEASMEEFEMEIMGKRIVGIKTGGWALSSASDSASLYSKDGQGGEVWNPLELKFIPYFAWGNRGPSDMRVWIASSTKADN